MNGNVEDNDSAFDCIEFLRENNVLEIQDGEYVGRNEVFYFSSSEDEVSLTSAQVYKLSEQLKSLAEGSHRSKSLECLELASYLFRSLAGAEDFYWERDYRSSGFFLRWKTSDFSVLEIHSYPPFDRFTVKHHEVADQVYESFTEAIQAVKSQLRDVLRLRADLSKLLPVESSLKCCGIWFDRPEYQVEYKQVGRIKPLAEIRNKLLFRVEGGQCAVILLISELFRPQVADRLEDDTFLSPYSFFSPFRDDHESGEKILEFPSKDDALRWLEANLNTFLSPIEFNAFCKE